MEEYPKLKVYNTHTEITQYELGENPKLEQKLSKYDKIYYRFIPIGYLYNDKKKSLLIPSGVSINMVSSMTDRPIEKEYETDPHDKISVRLRTLPRSELQKESIAFMLGEGQYSNYKNYSQLVLNLDTGEGKTYIAIASICIKQLKTINPVFFRYLTTIEKDAEEQLVELATKYWTKEDDDYIIYLMQNCHCLTKEHAKAFCGILATNHFYGKDQALSLMDGLFMKWINSGTIDGIVQPMNERLPDSFTEICFLCGALVPNGIVTKEESNQLSEKYSDLWIKHNVVQQNRT